MELWSLPEVLPLHLKRFSYSRYFRDKLETHVSFPLEGLDMSKYVLKPPAAGDPPAIYDCVGVSNHMGSLGGYLAPLFKRVVGQSSTPGSSQSTASTASSIPHSFVVTRVDLLLGGGHYTASCRSSVDGNWYKFNDSHTSQMNPEDV